MSSSALILHVYNIYRQINQWEDYSWNQQLVAAVTWLEISRNKTNLTCFQSVLVLLVSRMHKLTWKWTRFRERPTCFLSESLCKHSSYKPEFLNLTKAFGTIVDTFLIHSSQLQTTLFYPPNKNQCHKTQLYKANIC